MLLLATRAVQRWTIPLRSIVGTSGPWDRKRPGDQDHDRSGSRRRKIERLALHNLQIATRRCLSRDTDHRRLALRDSLHCPCFSIQRAISYFRLHFPNPPSLPNSAIKKAKAMMSSYGNGGRDAGPIQAIRLHSFVTEMIAILRVSNVTPSYQPCSMSDSSIV